MPNRGPYGWAVTQGWGDGWPKGCEDHHCRIRLAASQTVTAGAEVPFGLIQGTNVTQAGDVNFSPLTGKWQFTQQFDYFSVSVQISTPVPVDFGQFMPVWIAVVTGTPVAIGPSAGALINPASSEEGVVKDASTRIVSISTGLVPAPWDGSLGEISIRVKNNYGTSRSLTAGLNTWALVRGWKV